MVRDHKFDCSSLTDRRTPCSCGLRTYTAGEAIQNGDYYADELPSIGRLWTARAVRAKVSREQSNMRRVA